MNTMEQQTQKKRTPKGPLDQIQLGLVLET